MNAEAAEWLPVGLCDIDVGTDVVEPSLDANSVIPFRVFTPDIFAHIRRELFRGPIRLLSIPDEDEISFAAESYLDGSMFNVMQREDLKNDKFRCAVLAEIGTRLLAGAQDRHTKEHETLLVSSSITSEQ